MLSSYLFKYIQASEFDSQVEPVFVIWLPGVGRPGRFFSTA
jgi:hypothetical protein